jgi:hypothetical protein
MTAGTIMVSTCHDVDAVLHVLTLVLRVRLTTFPALMMRSNSKQPFWLTGDMMPTPAAMAWALSKRGWAGVWSFMPAERTGGGVVGVCCCASSAMVAMVCVAFNCSASGWWTGAQCWRNAGGRCG